MTRRNACIIALALTLMLTFAGCQNAPQPQKTDVAADTAAINALRDAAEYEHADGKVEGSEQDLVAQRAPLEAVRLNLAGAEEAPEHGREQACQREQQQEAYERVAQMLECRMQVHEDEA